MTSFLSLALLVTVTLLVPATALVFTVPRDDARSRHRAASLTVGVGVALGTAVVAVAVAALWGASPVWSVLAAVAIGSSVLAWWPVGRTWEVRGLLVWALTVDAGALFLAYVLWWTVASAAGALGLTAGLALWLLEAALFVVGLRYVWAFVDVRSSRSWPARRGALVVAFGLAVASASLVYAAPMKSPDISAIRAGFHEFPSGGQVEPVQQSTDPAGTLSPADATTERAARQAGPSGAGAAPAPGDAATTAGAGVAATTSAASARLPVPGQPPATVAGSTQVSPMTPPAPPPATLQPPAVPTVPTTTVPTVTQPAPSVPTTAPTTPATPTVTATQTPTATASSGPGHGHGTPHPTKSPSKTP